MAGPRPPLLRDKLGRPPHLGRHRGDDRQPVAAAAMDRVTLPDAAWRQRAGLAQLVDVLGAAAGETRIVGGAVRDTLLGIGLDIADVRSEEHKSELQALMRTSYA